MRPILDQTAMDDTVLHPEVVTTTRADLIWQDRLDALVSGHCTEDDFVDGIADLRESSPNSIWDIVALLDQRYRRGQMPATLYRSVESKLAQHALDTFDDDMTIDLPQCVGHSAVTAQCIGTAGILDRKTQLNSARPTPEVAGAEPASITASALRRRNRPPMRPMAIGHVLRDRYVLENRLGSGGMGTVYRAADRFRCDFPESERHVAIKILHEDLRSRPEVLTNLRREYCCTQTLSHKNIVRVYEIDRDGDVAFLTMELLEGKTLRAMMQQFHPLPVTRQYAWSIIRDIGAGLAHAHARHVIHGDLKPQNIFIMNSGEARILDFGTSSMRASERASLERSIKTDPTALTPAYASCELLDGEPADPRDDLYAFACLSYELLAGKHPFENKRSKEARDLGVMPRRPPGLTNRQWRALSMALSWERKDRSISVGDWIGELDVGSSLLGARARNHDRSAERVLRGKSPRRTIALLGVLLILIVTWGMINWPSKVPINGGDIRLSAAVSTVPAFDTAASNAAPLPTASPGSAESQVPSAESQVPHAVTPANVSSPTGHPLVPPARKALGHDQERATVRRESVNTIAIGARSYFIRSDLNFAEIRVRRSFGFEDDATFEWWTEPGSAQAGLDYVPQIRTTHAFFRGLRGASIFVKVLANPARQSARVFYVVIGNPSKGNSLGSVTRTAIRLPAVMMGPKQPRNRQPRSRGLRPVSVAGGALSQTS
jgi:serine/threonine protein kinase